MLASSHITSKPGGDYINQQHGGKKIVERLGLGYTDVLGLSAPHSFSQNIIQKNFSWPPVSFSTYFMCPSYSLCIHTITHIYKPPYPLYSVLIYPIHYTVSHSKTFYTHSFKNILHTLIQKHFTHTHSKTFFPHLIHFLFGLFQTLCGVLSKIFCRIVTPIFYSLLCFSVCVGVYSFVFINFYFNFSKLII